MHTIYATVLDIDPHNDETATECFVRLAEVMRVWSERALREWGIDTSVAFNGPPLVPRLDHWLRCGLNMTEECGLATIDWWHPGRPGIDERWQTVATLARHNELLELTLTVQVPIVEGYVNPTLYSNVRPGLLDDFRSAVRLSAAGWPVFDRPGLREPEDVIKYIAGTLVNPVRRLPAVLISGQVCDDGPLVDVDDYRRTLAGMADVTVLMNKDAGYKLTQYMGNKMLSCFDGAVRIYWPGFRLEDDPYSHRLYLKDSIQRDDDQGQTLLRHLLQELTDHALEHRPDCVAQEVRAILMPTRSATEDDSPRPPSAPAILPSLKSRFRAVEEVVLEAQSCFEETMLFLESAYSSARASSYGQPDEVWKLFEALHDIALHWQTDKRLRSGWYLAMKEWGFNYKDAISPTSLGKHGDEYKFLYQGEKRLFEHHVTLGAGRQRTHCMSLHWYRDDEIYKLVIGHCGPHLTNTRT